MRSFLLALTLTAAAFGSPVFYQQEGSPNSFLYISPNGFLPHDTAHSVPGASLQYCAAPCNSLGFNLFLSGSADLLQFDVGLGPSAFYNYPNGAFDASGVYQSLVGNVGTLRVTEVPITQPVTFYWFQSESSGEPLSFLYLSNTGFVSSDQLRSVPNPSLAFCSTPCERIQFNPSFSVTADILLFNIDVSTRRFFNFPEGAFNAVGTYQTLEGGHVGTLVVGQLVPVPEPGTAGLVGVVLALMAWHRANRSVSSPPLLNPRHLHFEHSNVKHPHVPDPLFSVQSSRR
jgi:hypothetical protein